MFPVACIVHQVRGRIRLRIREKRQDETYFEDARSLLESLPGIVQVSVNSSTASIVMHHELPNNDVLLERLDDCGLFVLGTESAQQTTTFAPLRNGLSGIEQALKSGTAGSVDLRTLAFLGMMGLTLHQILRGQVLGPALPMLWNAFSLIDRASSTPPEPGPVEDPSADAT
ncbi:MAG: hypothetical protein PVJ66_06160 [Gammaproteobacteria bacterium]|jgi:hypothetical protein